VRDVAQERKAKCKKRKNATWAQGTKQTNDFQCRFSPTQIAKWQKIGASVAEI